MAVWVKDAILRDSVRLIKKRKWQEVVVASQDKRIEKNVASKEQIP